MKIGDKVRFLNDVGGGIVTGFQGKNIVLVEDEDGFSVPVQSSEVVVIVTDDYNMEIPQKDDEPVKKPAAAKKETVEEEKEPETEEVPVELAGGDALNVSLAFVPEDIKMINATSFDTYLVNDSNYYLDYLYMSGENTAWKVRARGTVEPNMKVWLENFMQSSLNDIEHVCIQFIAYKKKRFFDLRPAMDIRLHIDTVKFYKVHCFGETDFFEQPAMMYNLVKNNVPYRSFHVDADDLQEEMMNKKNHDEQRPARIAKKEPKDEKIIVDLHINELLDTTAGMNNAEMLNYQLVKFREVMEENKNKKGQHIVFIHGKGEGILRKSILEELRRKYKNCSSQDASFQEYGFGATEVIVH